jgi:hypothetical protein
MPFTRLWGWPVALGLLTATGLITALVSDSWGDAWSWFALGAPVAAMTWHGLRRPQAASRSPTNSRR